jgi:hypothetical protein
MQQRAASAAAQFSKSAQSNQQDLIDKMETNRQQKRTRQGSLLP